MNGLSAVWSTVRAVQRRQHRGEAGDETKTDTTLKPRVAPGAPAHDHGEPPAYPEGSTPAAGSGRRGPAGRRRCSGRTASAAGPRSSPAGCPPATGRSRTGSATLWPSRTLNQSVFFGVGGGVEERRENTFISVTGVHTCTSVNTSQATLAHTGVAGTGLQS